MTFGYSDSSEMRSLAAKLRQTHEQPDNGNLKAHPDNGNLKGKPRDNMTYDIPVATYNIDIKGDTSFIPFLIIFTGV